MADRGLTATRGRWAALWCATAMLLGVSGCDETAPKFETVEIAGEAFRMELKLTAAEIREGMMGREKLGEREGMLFVFGDSRPRTFWMKNCKVELDMLFLDSGGRVVDMVTLPPPEPGAPDDEVPDHTSRWPAQFVIELNGGTAASLGVKAGDRVTMPLEKLKRLSE